MSDLYRRVTTRLPAVVLYRRCCFAAPLYYLHRTPLLGGVTRRLLPTSPHPRSAWRVLDTFDWYAPPYQSRHTYPEVFGWFRAAGLVELDLLDEPVAVRGRKPAER